MARDPQVQLLNASANHQDGIRGQEHKSKREIKPRAIVWPRNKRRRANDAREWIDRRWSNEQDSSASDHEPQF